MNGHASSPISSASTSGALRNMGRRISSAHSPGHPQLSPIITNGDSNLRTAVPRLNTHIQSQNPFRGNRGQPNVQPLNPQGMGYSPSGYVSQTSPAHDEQPYMSQDQLPMSYYLVNPAQQPQQQPHQRHSISTYAGSNPANPPTPIHASLRRSHTTPALSQQSPGYPAWTSQMSSGSMVNGIYHSPYSPSTQPHSAHSTHSGHPAHGPQSGSNPPTPVTATSYQPLQLPPPLPLPPMHQHQHSHSHSHSHQHQHSHQHSSPTHDIPGNERGDQQGFDAPAAMTAPIRPHQGMSHVSYSDFLANEHDLGVQENAAGNEDGPGQNERAK